MEKFTSTDQTDYEILIRRYDNGANYASYCPQLAHMIKGTEHEEVENLMKEYVLAYIASLESSSSE
ncbi:MAG: hypothetical protein JNL36_10820 [Candidatus Kapabacteria bacterium]|nr:hypothetical protein [Candidatus Kapabacteria bacterium]